jgi:hypothetical protein
MCNKLISTTAHESVKIISTKWFMHIRKNLIILKDQTNKMYQSSREICLRKSGVRYA